MTLALPFKAEDKVKHAEFGTGKVIFANAQVTRVRFKGMDNIVEFRTVQVRSVCKKAD